jgi:hypothetical protein
LPLLWYGIEGIARQTKGKKERLMAGQRNEQPTDLHKQIDYMLTGARTILPGIQALLGFQLAVIFRKALARFRSSLNSCMGLHSHLSH